jgi:hypothetical protein
VEKNYKQMATWQAIYKGDSSKSDSKDAKISVVQKMWRCRSPSGMFLNNIAFSKNLHLLTEQACLYNALQYSFPVLDKFSILYANGRKQSTSFGCT